MAAPAGSDSYRFGNLSNPVAPSGDCFGIWPPHGQSYYANGCYGHDEPGIQFYSTLPGSGGNVSWNVTLPISRNTSATQSDLYTAIWFGMTLSDPYAWLDQCFLELQFYPDADWNSPGAVFGHWVGAAVAWQINAANGYEDACFYAPLILGDGAELLMHDGDQVTVTMSGWIADPYGENLTIVDGTNGEVSTVTLYNSAQGYPLDPAYVTSADTNSLQWTPGGEMPVSFAFETGHTTYPYPNNNSYGGCSAGVPPSTRKDPAVPCPSYDPGSWLNDTVQPWRIAPPTFFNATASRVPAQASFTQDLGGIAVIDPLSNYTCAGRDGSAWCSYPWYSFSCTDDAFEFGATDYATTSQDFGGFGEYSTSAVKNALRLGFYPPGNFSVPTCGGPSATVSIGPAVAGAGGVVFLGHGADVNRSFDGLAPGEYPLTAVPRGTDSFAGWVVTGGVRITDTGAPSTTLWISGNGTVAARFSPSASPTVPVTVSVSPTSGHVVVLPSLYYTNGHPLATLGNGDTVDLAPGVYSIQAYPPPGDNFSSWSVVGGSVAAPAFIYTWLTVPSNTSGVNLSAQCVASIASDRVLFATYYGKGNVSFNGSTPATSGSATVAVGTYSLEAVPAAGWALKSWYIPSSGVLSDFSASTNLTLEEGTTYYVYAAFAPLVQLEVAPAGGGSISLSGALPSANQSAYLSPGIYSVLPVPAAGYAFSGWSASAPSEVWVYPAGGGTFDMQVNTSGTVTASFTTQSAVNLTFVVEPAGAGTIDFNFVAYDNGSSNSTLTVGDYLVTERPSGGYNFSAWSVAGPLAWTSANLLAVNGSGGVLTVEFDAAQYPVTVTTSPAVGPRVNLTGGSIGTSTLSLRDGTTTWMGGIGLIARAVFGNTSSFLRWTTSPDLTTNPTTPTPLGVTGPGTLTLFIAGYTVSASVTPSAIDLGQSLALVATVQGAGTYSFQWQGLPSGCSSVDRADLTCTPNSVGVYGINVTVTASDGTSQTAWAGTVSIEPALVIGPLNTTPTELTVGRAVQLAAEVAGGVAPLGYAWGGLPVDCPAANAAQLTCRPSTPGVYYISLTVADAAGVAETANASLTVHAQPLLTSFVLSRPLTDVGLPIVLTVGAEYGTRPLSFDFAGLPPGCLSANVTALSCTPSASGVFLLTATVTDLDGFSSQLNQTLIVDPAPAVTSLTATGWSGVVNRSLDLVAAVTGGAPPLTYVFTGLPPGCASQNSSTLHCTPSAEGNYTVVLVVSDVLDVTASAILNLSVGPPPAPPPASGTTTPAGGVPLWAWIVVVVAVVGVVAGLAYWRRRGRSPGTIPDDETPYSGAGRGEGPPTSGPS